MTFEDPLFQPPPRSTACSTGMPSAGFARRVTTRGAGASRAPQSPSDETVPGAPARFCRCGQRHPTPKDPVRPQGNPRADLQAFTSKIP